MIGRQFDLSFLKQEIKELVWFCDVKIIALFNSSSQGFDTITVFLPQFHSATAISSSSSSSSPSLTNIDHKLQQLRHSSRIGYLCAYSGIVYWALPLVEPTDLNCQTFARAVSLSTLATFLECPVQLVDHQLGSMRSIIFWSLRISKETRCPIH